MEAIGWVLTAAWAWVCANPWQALQALYAIYSYANKKDSGSGGVAESRTYSSNAASTNCDNNSPKAVIYGEHKCAGNIIYQRFSSDMELQFLLVAMCVGEIEGMSNICLNDTPIENFSNVTYDVYNGTPDQTVDNNALPLKIMDVDDITGLHTNAGPIGPCTLEFVPNYGNSYGGGCAHMRTKNFGWITTDIVPINTGYGGANYTAQVKVQREGGQTGKVLSVGLQVFEYNINGVFIDTGLQPEQVFVTLPRVGDSSTWPRLPFNGGVLEIEGDWATITLLRNLRGASAQLAVTVEIVGDPNNGTETAGIFLDAFRLARGNYPDSRVMYGDIEIGGLRNLAYIGLTLNKTQCGDGTPNITAIVKGRKVKAYNELGSVTNLLTTNQADPTSLTSPSWVVTGAGVSLSVDTTQSLRSGSSLLVTTTGSGIQGIMPTYGPMISPSFVYTFDIWLRGSGTVYITMDEGHYSGIYTSLGSTDSSPIVLTTTWTKYSVSRLFGANANCCNVYIRSNGSVASFNCDKMMVYKGSAIDVWMEGGRNIGWTDNPAYCVTDLLLDQRNGVGYTESQIDLNSIYSVAQNCATLIYSEGAWIPRFRLDVVLDWKEAWLSVFDKLRMNFLGYALEINGKFTLKQLVGGTSQQSFVYSTDRTTIGSIVPKTHVVNWNSVDQDYDVVRSNFTDRDNQWTRQPAECRDQHSLALANPVILTVELYGTTRHNQASRLSAVNWKLYQLCKVTGQFTTTMIGDRRTPGDIIDITDPRFGWTNRMAIIMTMKSTSANEVQIGYVLYDSNVYTDDIGTASPGNTISVQPNPWKIPDPPLNLAATETNILSKDGHWTNNLVVTFQPAQANIDYTLIQISKDGGLSYSDCGSSYGTSFTITPLSIGDSCLIKATTISIKRIPSLSTIVGPITIIGDKVPPPVPGSEFEVLSNIKGLLIFQD